MRGRPFEGMAHPEALGTADPEAGAEGRVVCGASCCAGRAGAHTLYVEAFECSDRRRGHGAPAQATLEGGRGRQRGQRTPGPIGAMPVRYEPMKKRRRR